METWIDCSQLPFEIISGLAGVNDAHFKIIERNFPARLYLKQDRLKIVADSAEDIERIQNALQAIVQSLENNREREIEETEVERLVLLARSGQDASENFSEQEPLVRTRNGKLIFPKTHNQQLLVDAFRSSKMIFASGVAGTGKTYLAVAWAVDQLKKEAIKKIILTRPAVEAGESLGFLPGDMKEKVDPYLRPLYDALGEMLGQEALERFQEKEIIEIAPLAFMRGRTLNDAVVILDEAQNTTRAQMKMFLTRMGRNCQMIINGDITQTDLVVGRQDSGLREACSILKGIDEISIITLDQSDVVRNPLVQKIIARYEQIES